MAKIISFVNEKGGVGKTTGAREIGGILGKKKKVLLVDCDFQRNLTGSFPLEYDKTIYDLLINGETDVIVPINEKVSIIPGDVRLRGIDKELYYVDSSHKILKNFVDKIQKNFDYIIFDLHPSMGEAEKNCLVASEFLIIPIEAHYFSLDGLEILEVYQQELEQELGHELKSIIYFNRVGKGNAPLVIMEEMHQQRKNILKSFIRDTVKIKEASMTGEFLIDYAKTSNGVKDFKELIKELKGYGI